jgi:hypothetical protein
MRLIILLLFILIAWSLLFPVQDGIREGSDLKYRFNYTFQGETSGVILLLFRYRFFFNAEASVFLKATRVNDKTLRFDFLDIDKPGLLIRTWGFGGKILITAAADYNLEKVRQLLEQDFSLLKKKAPGYCRFIKRRFTFPFKLISRGEGVMSFKREAGGIHRDFSLAMEVQALKPRKKHDFYFKIYPMLLEMAKIYNHTFLPGNSEPLSGFYLGREWKSQLLDYTQGMNCIGRQATGEVEKYVTFKQERPFKLTYRVISVEPARLIIKGEALPRVKIWNGYYIESATRTVELALPRGTLLCDRLQVEIRNKKGRGGFARCALTLVE